MSQETVNQGLIKSFQNDGFKTHMHVEEHRDGVKLRTNFGDLTNIGTSAFIRISPPQNQTEYNGLTTRSFGANDNGITHITTLVNVVNNSTLSESFTVKYEFAFTFTSGNTTIILGSPVTTKYGTGNGIETFVVTPVGDGRIDIELNNLSNVSLDFTYEHDMIVTYQQ